MTYPDRFSNPAAHPLTADLVARLESAEKEINELKSRLKVAETVGREVRPRPDADLEKLSKRFSAEVFETGGDFTALGEGILGQSAIIHHPKRMGAQLYAVTNIRRGEPLHVILHGAMVNGTWFPRFERVRSMNEAGLSFCSIADPTIQLDLGLKLGWYAGHDGVNPIDLMVGLVESLVRIAVPSQLVFVGSSGGGYASLQLSRHFPDSLAFVTDPQTVIPNYYEAQVRRLLHVGFDDMSPESALEAFPDRFSAPANYQRDRPENYVYYAQHRWDKFHIENHLWPFARTLGIKNPTNDVDANNFRLRMFDKGKHGPLSPELFDKHLGQAKAWHSKRMQEAGRAERR